MLETALPHFVITLGVIRNLDDVKDSQTTNFVERINKKTCIRDGGGD